MAIQHLRYNIEIAAQASRQEKTVTKSIKYFKSFKKTTTSKKLKKLSGSMFPLKKKTRPDDNLRQSTKIQKIIKMRQLSRQNLKSFPYN